MKYKTPPWDPNNDAYLWSYYFEDSGISEREYIYIRKNVRKRLSQYKSYIINFEDAVLDIEQDVVKRILQKRAKEPACQLNNSYIYKAIDSGIYQYIKTECKHNHRIVPIDPDMEWDIPYEETGYQGIFDKETIKEILEALNEEISKMSDIDRRILILRRKFNYSYKEIEKMTGLRNEALRTRFYRANKVLMQKVLEIVKIKNQ